MATEPTPSVEPGGEPPKTRAEVFDLVKQILVDQLGAEESDIKDSAGFQEDLDADSLDLVELIMELEDKNNIKISDEDARTLQTVGQAVDYICKELGITE